VTKHHYIPRCYLKGFCRSDGTFDVYDKRFDSFRKAPQSPGTVYYERHLNTVRFKGQPTDDIERMYSRIETGLGQLFDHIRSGAASDHVLQPDGIYLLKAHIATQFWRLPRFDNYATQFLLRQTIEDVAQICSRCAASPLPSAKIMLLLRTDSGFRHYFRSFWLPLGTSDLARSIPSALEWKILDVEQSSRWANHLCTDLPFICEEPESLLRFDSPFIFPLSASRLLVSRARKASSQTYDPLFSTKVATLTFCQAPRYVAGTDRRFIEQVVNFAASYSAPLDVARLRREVLAYLS
jgi:hypothetical protein